MSMALMREARQVAQVRRDVQTDPELKRSDHPAECATPAEDPQDAAHVVQRAKELGGDQRDSGDHRELHQQTVGARQLGHGQHLRSIST